MSPLDCAPPPESRQTPGMTAAPTPGPRNKYVLTLLPGLAFLLLVGFFTATLFRQGFSGHDPSELPSAMIDKPAPDFTLPPALDDRPGLARADFGGQPVLVNFFASWCVPCRLEHGTLSGFAASGRVPVVGIAFEDKAADSKRFLAELGDPYQRVGLDPDGHTGIDFGVYGVPETYLVDAEGKIRYRWVGPLTPEAVEKEILPRLAALQKK
jgi:DsbE subfamily thiol:disulfide oxidoreductase